MPGSSGCQPHSAYGTNTDALIVHLDTYVFAVNDEYSKATHGELRFNAWKGPDSAPLSWLHKKVTQCRGLLKRDDYF